MEWSATATAGQAGRVPGGTEGWGREDRGPLSWLTLGGPWSCGAQGAWAPRWAAGAQTPLGPGAWWEGAQAHDRCHPAIVTLGQSGHFAGLHFLMRESKQSHLPQKVVETFRESDLPKCLEGHGRAPADTRVRDRLHRTSCH